MGKKGTKQKLPQFVLILRAIGGAYLLYLAWGLREAAFSGWHPVYLTALVVFALAGGALLVVSALPLIRGEFLRPGESQEEQP